jgi:phosphate transport system substrate-binding protein
MNNDMAVSPIVATLVLIVVAVIGAVAVGTIMGTFSSDVSKQANSGNAASQAQTEILVAGSTSVYPTSVKLAADYENQHPGIKITVQQGGSGAGVTSAALGIADIGATSTIHSITDAQTANPLDQHYQNLQYTQIGGSAVVWCANSNAGVTGPLTAAIVLGAYNDASNATGISTAYTTGGATIPAGTIMETRESGSGTMETAGTWLNGGTVTKSLPGVINQGNEGMLATLQSTTHAFGFLDYGYTVGASGITAFTVSDNGAGSFQTYTASATNIKNGLKDLFHGFKQDTTGGSAAKSYPLNLVRGYYYVTEGTPSSVVADFINFAKTPSAAAQDFDTTNSFGITEFA